MYKTKASFFSKILPPFWWPLFEHLAESCHTAAKKGGVWDEDEGPAELLCIEDATTADLIEILRTAGIDDNADFVDSRNQEATRIPPHSPPQSPLAETDDETSEFFGGEATRENAVQLKRIPPPVLASRQVLELGAPPRRQGEPGKPQAQRR